MPISISSPTAMAIERAASALATAKSLGLDLGYRSATMPRFCYRPDGSPDGWVWAIQIGLGLSGWCAGQRRLVSVTLPFRGDRPGNPWQPPEEAMQAVSLLVAGIDRGGITFIEPGSQDARTTATLVQPIAHSVTAHRRASAYNKSSGRAVRLRRAAHSAQRHAYF